MESTIREGTSKRREAIDPEEVAKNVAAWEHYWQERHPEGNAKAAPREVAAKATVNHTARDWINDFLPVSDETERASEPEAGPSDEDLDDAWKQYEEEKEPSSEDEQRPEAEPEVEIGPEPEPEPEARQTAGEAVAQAVRAAAVKQRGPRKPTSLRKLPHGGCTGVWIPREVYEDPRFQSFNEMILYLEVNHLDKENGCTAKNKHFADYLGCNVQTVQDMIHSLAERGFFVCAYPSRTSRIIHIAGGRRSYPRHRG